MIGLVRAVVLARFVGFSGPLEGVIRTFYRDVRNLVTTAIGALVDPVELALLLPLVRADGTLATKAEIREEWELIKRTPGLDKAGWREAAKLCKLHLTPEGIEQVTRARLEANVRELVRRFPEFPSWPADAQLAALSMAWALGAGFEKEFPKCAAYLRARDFAGAAAECTIREVGNPGVKPRNIANRQLLLNAQRVEDDGLDPSVFFVETDASVPEPPRPMTEQQAAQVAFAFAHLFLSTSINDVIEQDWRESA